MQYRCNAAPNAVPVIRVSTHDDTGKLLAKPKNHTKVVKNGAILYAVPDRCSRKHFTALDAEAKAQNEADYKAMLAEAKKIGMKVPPGTSFAVLADSLAKYEYDCRQTKKAEKPVLLTVPSAPKRVDAPDTQPSTSDNAKIAEADEKKALKKAITAKGGKFTNFMDVKKLREINAKLEGR
jgi:hypothetical protein